MPNAGRVLACFFLLLLPLLSSAEVLADTCQCDSCSSCTSALNNATCGVVQMNASIPGVSGTCIDDPANFTAKTFDCQGFGIQGDGVGSDYGISLVTQHNNTIKNCNVTSFYNGFLIVFSTNDTFLNNNLSMLSQYGIQVVSSGRNNLVNNRIQGGQYGITLSSSDNNTLTSNVVYDASGIGIQISSSNNNVLTSNGAYNISSTGIDVSGKNNTLSRNVAYNNSQYGISLTSSVNNTVFNNTLQENFRYDFYVTSFSDSDCNNNVTDNTGSGNLPILYYNRSVALSDMEASEVFLCNADNSSLANITVRGSDTLKNNGVYLTRTENANLTGLNSTENYFGVYLASSGGSHLDSGTFSRNSQSGVFITSSNGMKISSIAVHNNSLYGVYLSASSNNTLTGAFISNNTPSDIYILSNAVNNTFSNQAIGWRYPTNASFVSSGTMSVKQVDSPQANPAGYANISRYINVTNGSAGAWMFLNITYSDSDVSPQSGSGLRMAKHNGSWWTDPAGFSNLYGVDTANNVVYANITRFGSDFCPLSDILPPRHFSSLQNASSSNIGDAVLLSANWTDENALSSAFLSTNETGSWANRTGSALALAGKSQWSNFTWANASVPGGTAVGWMVWANDTAGNFNATDVKAFAIVDNMPPRHQSAGQGGSSVALGGSTSLFSYWTDETQLSSAILSTNETGSWLNYTESVLPLSGTGSWSNFTWSNSSVPAGTVIGWQAWANDTAGNWNSTAIQSFATVDNIPPKYFSVGQNTSTPNIGDSVKLYANWTDETALSAAVLSTNETGSWLNYTESVLPLSGTGSWSNFTWSNSSVPAGAVVGWRIWSNDSSGNWNVTDEMSFPVPSPPVTTTIATTTTVLISSKDEPPREEIDASSGTSAVVISYVAQDVPLAYSFESPSDSLPVTGFTLTPARDLAGIKVTFSPAEAPPAATAPAVAPKGRTLSYFQARTTNFADSSLSGAKITFRVSNNLLSKEGLDSGSIVLNRLEGSAEGSSWRALITRLVGSDGENSIYEAETPGFSLFAISGSPAGAGAQPEETITTTVEPPASTIATTSIVPTAETPGAAGEPSLPALILVLVFAGAVFLAAAARG